MDEPCAGIKTQESMAKRFSWFARNDSAGGACMSFDPMAAAIDWLDAYRAGDIKANVGMYAEDALIYCGCGARKTITGSEARCSYWADRFNEHPASRLDNIQPLDEGALISYVVREGSVSAVLRFNPAGQISSHTCGQN
jgi:hypothetical protein